MKESYSKGIANHTGPESCENVCENELEALTGEDAGRAIEPRKLDKLRGADAVMASGRQHRWIRHRQESTGPRAVEEPRHARTLIARKPGDPMTGCVVERSPHREPLRG